MSNKDIAKQLIDQIPDYKLIFVIPYLQGAAIPEEVPNDETINAFEELDNNGGYTFSGNTADLFAELQKD